MIAEFTYTGDAEASDDGARGRAQTRWVVIAMIFGVAIGFYFPDGPTAGVLRATELQFLSTVFLRMIKSLMAPLVFATLVVGIAGHGDDMKRVGKLALRSIFYFEIVTTLALVVGLTIVNVVQPGRGVILGFASDSTSVALARRSGLARRSRCTSLNVVGNCLATVLLSRWEGSFTLSQDDAPTHLSPELRGAPT